MEGSGDFFRRAAFIVWCWLANQAPLRSDAALGMLLSACFAAVLLQAQPVAPRQVVAVDRDGRKHAGLLAAMENGQLAIGAGDAGKLSTRDLVWLKFSDRNSVASPTDPLVILAGGDVLALRVDTIGEVDLVGHWTRFLAWPEVRVPLELVRAVILSRPADADARLWNRLTSHDEKRDLVLLANDDSLSGDFIALNETALTLEAPAGRTILDRSGVRALAFSPDLTARESSAGEQVLLSLIDGSHFRVKSLRLVGRDRFELQPVFGGRFEAPLAAVEALRFLGGCATFLSRLEPDEYKFEPFLDLDWPWRANRSVAGGPLRLRGVAWPTGLGMHSRSELSYRLDGRYRWFTATIGIDDETAGKGSAVFEVLVDGRRAFQSAVLTGSSPAVAIERLDLAGAKRLTLRVDYGSQGDINDHADWCDAVLVK